MGGASVPALPAPLVPGLRLPVQHDPRTDLRGFDQRNYSAAIGSRIERRVAEPVEMDPIAGEDLFRLTDLHGGTTSGHPCRHDCVPLAVDQLAPVSAPDRPNDAGGGDTPPLSAIGELADVHFVDTLFVRDIREASAVRRDLSSPFEGMDAEGNTITKGKWANAIQMVDGKWQVQYDIFNYDAPMAAPE